jgi:hypothetical protein
MKLSRFLKISLLLILPQFLMGQYFFRIKCDFSVKEKSVDDTYRLVIGTVYYDMNHKKIVYDIQFPEKELWVLSDTLFYVFKDHKLVKKQQAFIFPEFSIFNLVLQGDLKDYGLKDHPVLKVKEIERDGDRVIRTWRPIEDYKENLGVLKMSTKGKKLDGIIFYNPDGRLMSRQFFENYISVRGIEFPTDIIQFIYPNPEVYEKTSDQEMIIKTTYRNIQLNRTDEEFMYNYPIPLD